MNVTGKLCLLRPALRSCRNLHVTHFLKSATAYEGPGKTTVTFVSKMIGPRLLVNHCDQFGFTLNSGVKIIGPMVLFPRRAICWNIMSGEHINEATLSLFTVLEPKPDLLIIGLDDKYDFAFVRNIQNLVQKHNITVEIVSVFHACTAFNFVNEEGRYVIAALIPQKSAGLQLALESDNESERQITDGDASDKENDAKTSAK